MIVWYVWYGTGQGRLRRQPCSKSRQALPQGYNMVLSHYDSPSHLQTLQALSQAATLDGFSEAAFSSLALRLAMTDEATAYATASATTAREIAHRIIRWPGRDRMMQAATSCHTCNAAQENIYVQGSLRDMNGLHANAARHMMPLSAKFHHHSYRLKYTE
jgi:hypothetical protein